MSKHLLLRNICIRLKFPPIIVLVSFFSQNKCFLFKFLPIIVLFSSLQQIGCKGRLIPIVWWRRSNVGGMRVLWGVKMGFRKADQSSRKCIPGLAIYVDNEFSSHVSITFWLTPFILQQAMNVTTIIQCRAKSDRLCPT